MIGFENLERKLFPDMPPNNIESDMNVSVKLSQSKELKSSSQGEGSSTMKFYYSVRKNNFTELSAQL